MNKIFARLGVFFIGFPLSVAIVVLLPHKNHVVANAVVTVLAALAALELAEIFQKKGLAVPKTAAFVYGLVPPALVSAVVSFGVPFMAALFAIMALAVWILIRGLLGDGSRLGDFAGQVAGSFAVLFYPGLFLVWIILLNKLPDSTFLLAFLISVVVVTDSFGWAFGVLWGKNNRGVIRISPNKSVAGYVGSFAGALAVSLGALRLYPAGFAGARIGAPALALVLGLGAALMSQAGDLVESAIKRSAGVKDSGGAMPGRGGILDSIDSLAFAAPFFYFCYSALRS